MSVLAGSGKFSKKCRALEVFRFLMGSKITYAWVQKLAQKLGLRGDGEAGPIKDIKELDPTYMPKQEGPSQRLG